MSEFQDWTEVKIYGKPKPSVKKEIVKKVPQQNGHKKADNNDGSELDIKIWGTEYGRKVMQARNEKKMTQKELARKLSLTVKDIQEVENGKGLVKGNIASGIFRILGVKRN